VGCLSTVSNDDYRPDLERNNVERHLMDTKVHYDSKPAVRFFLERVEDETGVSGTGRVLEAVIWQDGSVTAKWRPPMSTETSYKDFETFLRVHVTSHPSKSKVVFIDEIEKSRVDLSFALGHVEFRGGVL